MEKITKRMIYTALANIAEDLHYEDDGEVITIPAEVVAEFAVHEVELLDNRAESTRKRAAKKKEEGDALTEEVLAVLTEEEATIADITAKLGEREDVTVAKVQYRLAQLARNGKAEKVEITIPATEGTKARKVSGYRLLVEE